MSITKDYQGLPHHFIFARKFYFLRILWDYFGIITVLVHIETVEWRYEICTEGSFKGEGSTDFWREKGVSHCEQGYGISHGW